MKVYQFKDIILLFFPYAFQKHKYLKEYLHSKKYVCKKEGWKVLKEVKLLEAYAAAHHRRMWTYSM